jgi:hypothetical protein
MLALVVAAMAAAEAAGPAPAPPAPTPREPRLARDVALAAAASAAVALIKPDIRRAILRDGRFRNVAYNFANPVEAVREGTERDHDPFWVNGVAHPVLFGLEGLYLKHQGYGNGHAFLFTQVHSVVWELVIEGCAFPPSGKDLLTDAAGAALAIWVVHPLLSPHADLAVSPLRGGGAAIHFAARF